MIKVTLPIETPVIHVPLSGRVGGTLPHKSYSSLSWEDQTAYGHLHGQSPRSGFAVIGPFEPMPYGTGIAPPRCHPPPDGGTLRHVNNSLPGPVSEGSVHGNGSIVRFTCKEDSLWPFSRSVLFFINLLQFSCRLQFVDSKRSTTNSTRFIQI